MLVRAANIQDHVVVERLAIALAQQEGSCGQEGGNILSGDQVFVAEIGAAIVGAAVVHKHDDALWQLTLFVRDRRPPLKRNWQSFSPRCHRPYRS